jgi:uncharacterized protein YqeY
MAMVTKEQLNSDLREALRGQDETGKSAIRMVLSAIHNAEIAAGHALDAADLEPVLAREAKVRRESIDEFRKAGRDELVAREEAELAVVLRYLPAQLSHEDILDAARRVIARVGARGPSDKGKVMPVIIAELRGKADGSQINAAVTELLAQL